MEKAMSYRDIKIAVVGCGRVGTALAVSLCKAGYKVSVLWSRDSKKAARIAIDCGAASRRWGGGAQADMVFLTVIDPSPGTVAANMAEELKGCGVTGRCFTT